MKQPKYQVGQTITTDRGKIGVIETISDDGKGPIYCYITLSGTKGCVRESHIVSQE